MKINSTLIFFLSACCLGLFHGIFSFSFSQSAGLIELSSGWQFRKAGDSLWQTAVVPGVVHSDLLRHQLIPNPHYRSGEQDAQWIENEDWEYTTTFEISPQTLAKKNIELVFKGLDTYSDIFLNGTLLLKADNMFREWMIPCKQHLKAGLNTLSVYFHSPVKMASPACDSLPYRLPAGNDTGPKKVSVFTRKAPYHYGWDWGPRLLTCGIWRPVFLRTWETARIEEL